MQRGRWRPAFASLLESGPNRGIGVTADRYGLCRAWRCPLRARFFCAPEGRLRDAMKPPTSGPFGVSPGSAAAAGGDPFAQATALHRAGRPDQAVPLYRQALARAPGFVGGWCNLGIALKQAGRMGEALAAYRRAIELDPGSADAQFNLALALNEVGQGAEAETALRQAIASRART